MSIRRIIYKCDICSKETGKDGNYGIFIRNPGEDTPLKKYDLCKKCYKEINAIIKKQNGGTNDG